MLATCPGPIGCHAALRLEICGDTACAASIAACCCHAASIDCAAEASPTTVLPPRKRRARKACHATCAPAFASVEATGAKATCAPAGANKQSGTATERKRRQPPRQQRDREERAD